MSSNNHAPLLTSVDREAINLRLGCCVLFVRNFGVPSHVERVSSARPWASPGQPENSRSDLVKSHLAGRRRAASNHDVREARGHARP